MTQKITIPFSELTFSFSRSSGAGGQNINKVNSKATMYWDLVQSNSCSSAIKNRFREKFPNIISPEGVVQIVSQKNRTQKANINDCIEKLHAMINSVATPPRPRRATAPTKSSVFKRLDGKKHDSAKKNLRKKNFE